VGGGVGSDTVSRGAAARRRSTFDGNGNFVRGPDAVWRYTSSRQPVRHATDVVLGDVYPAEPGTYEGRSYRIVPHRWIRRRGDHPLAWVRSAAGVIDRPERGEYLVPTALWRRRASDVLGMLAPELHPLALLDLDDVARAAGVKPATVRAYLHRRQMPDPVSRAGGSPMWTRPTIEGWLETRRVRRRSGE
jgi:predicted DNA-binding transcriptional regulator AlpA